MGNMCWSCQSLYVLISNVMANGDQWQFRHFGWQRFAIEQPQPPLVSPWPPKQRETNEIFDKMRLG